MGAAGELSGLPVPRVFRPGDLDFFIDPPWCIEALLRAERYQGVSWDPACGSRTIPKALWARGLVCHASDAAARGQDVTHDFLGAGPAPFGPVDNIINATRIYANRRNVPLGLFDAS